MTTPTTLRDRLTSDLTASIKERTAFNTGVLRMVLGDIQSQEKSGKTAQVFDDAAVMKVLTKAVKQRRESAEIYAKAGAQDRAETETREADFISTYLPEPLTTEALEAIVAEVVADEGATTRKDMGRVIKAVTAKVAGQASGKEVSTAVMARLS